MKKNLKRIFQKTCSIFMVIGVFLSSFTGIPFKLPEAHALATVDGDKIIETAQTYSDWGYWEIGTCTGFVTRTLNKLGIGESIVGIHPYDIDKVQPEGTGARYAPDAMYRNAMNHPEDAVLVWQGYKKDIEANAHLFKNGDLIIERIQDKANPDGNGHVSFMHIYGNTIASYGAGTRGIYDSVYATDVNFNTNATAMSNTNNNSGIMLLAAPSWVNGNDYISVFRLTQVEPEYDKVSSEKSADEKVEVAFHKIDNETGKPLSGVTVDFYRDGVKFATGTTGEDGYAKATSTTTFTSTSEEKEYCTNYDELDDEGKQEVIDKGAYKYKLDAQTSADAEAQRNANALASQTHRYSVVETQTKTKYWLDDNNKTVSDSLTGSGSITLNLKNERVTGSAKIQKIDYDSTVAQNEASLDGAIYGLYANETILDPADASIIYKAREEVARVRIENGEGLVEDLYLGSYIWKEITAGEGYKLDTNTYPINLEYEGQSVKTVTAKTTVSEKVITGNFEIEKVITSGDEDSGVVEKEQGAEFMVVAKKYVDKYGTIEQAWEHRTEFTNKEYDYLTTNKNGYAKSKDLAYGNFVIKQVKGQMDLEMVKDEWTFTVSRENQDTIKYIVNNKIFMSYVRLVKKDAETDKTITLSNTTFKILDLSTNETLKQKVGDKTLEEWTTNESGEFVLPLEVKAGSYKLIEIKSPNLYLMNNEGVEFKVTNSNIIETDPDGDAITTVVMYDEPVKGIINVEKQGEVLTGVTQNEDGNYTFDYNKVCLGGMTVEIEAREDIIDPADGSILFAKGTVVDTITTQDYTCENFSSELPLGSYTVYETYAPNGMVLDKNKYDIDLTFKDNETEVIIETLSITNERQKVELDITKLDKDDETPLEGVVFGLYATKDILRQYREPMPRSVNRNVLIEAGTLIETAISDKDGKVIFNADLPLSFDDETYFEVKEIESLGGYYSSEDIITVNTKYQGQDKEKVETSNTVYNEAIKNYILINKVDSLSMENIISKDFSFNLCTDAECENVVDTFYADQATGTALIDIKFGTWFVKEASAPLGYSLSEEVIKVVLNSEGLYVNDELVETDEELTYSIVYQNYLLPVIQTAYDVDANSYIIVGSLSIAGLLVGTVLLCKKKKNKR